MVAALIWSDDYLVLILAKSIHSRHIYLDGPYVVNLCNLMPIYLSANIVRLLVKNGHNEKKRRMSMLVATTKHGSFGQPLSNSSCYWVWWRAYCLLVGRWSNLYLWIGHHKTHMPMKLDYVLKL